MRAVFVVIHRWLGLFAAVFLFIAGATGAVISWDHELDEWLNPELFHADSGAVNGASSADTLAIADQLERDDPRLRVGYIPLSVEPGHTLSLFVGPRVDPKTGAAYELGFNQLAVDPETHQIQGRRTWGEVSLERQNLLSFLYKLHYTMHIPDGFGVEVGVVFMGIVAVVWALDCFIALWLSFPNRKTWRKSFAFRVREGRAKLTFDLHRSGGVWLWPLLLMLAVTAVSMNLRDQVMRPVVSLFSPLSEDPFSSRSPGLPIEPTVSRERVIALATAEARKRGVTADPGGVSYISELGVYSVGFFAPGHDHGDGGLGNPWLYFDARDGRSLGGSIPGEGSLGDVFMQAQFPLHSGRIFGVFGRIFVSLLGLLVATLSVTGVLIWARKRRARLWSAARQSPVPLPQSVRGSQSEGPSVPGVP